MKRAIIAGAVGGLVMFAVLALPAKAQMIACGSVSEVFEALQNGHGEQKAGYGVTSRGAAMILFVNPDTRSWSLVHLIPNPPRACLMSSGESWETLEPEKESH